ncbi:MAG: nitronate monooxygenase [Pseudomonadota bacterium]|nr:nitronate monooxygenase [Pseudomonadota bacterium]
MITTRINEIFRLRHPIVQGGMIWVSGWRLAAAVSKAGALGLIGAGSMTPELLRAHIRKIKNEDAEGVWGVNLPIFFQYAEEMARIILEEKVRVVFTSGGSPRKYTSRFKDAGIKVAHVTATPELAVKCEEAGVDAVVMEGFEAGGHNGRDELTTMVLVPQTVDAVKIPVIAAGGIFDGRGMAAALAMGAAGVQIGTRFAATRESSAHDNFKGMILNARPTDTFLILRKLIPARVIKNPWYERVVEAEKRGASPEELLRIIGEKRTKIGMFEGDLREGELQIGQAAGAIGDLPAAGDVVDAIARDCERIMAEMPGQLLGNR